MLKYVGIFIEQARSRCRTGTFRHDAIDLATFPILFRHGDRACGRQAKVGIFSKRV
jgi:hypothetical protein